MVPMFAPRFGFKALVITLTICLASSVGQTQVLPPLPPTSPQGDVPREPTDQSGNPQDAGRQTPPPPTQTVPPGQPRDTLQRSGQPTEPAQRASQIRPSVIAPADQPQDPFRGSPLLRSFERRPDALAPLRELRYAPLPDLPTPLGVNLSLTAEEEFTDNADQTKDNRRSEFRTRIVPGIAVQADRPWLTASLLYAPEIFIPNNSISETELHQNLSLRGTLWPGRRFQFSLAEDFTDSNQFQDRGDLGSRNTGQQDFRRNEVTAEAAYVIPRLRTAVAYTNIIVSTDEVDQGFWDTRITHQVRPNVTYADPRITVAASFTLTRGDENSSLSVPFWAYQGDGRFAYRFTSAFSAGLAGYYLFQEPDVGLNFSIARSRLTGTLGVGPSGTLETEAGADFFTQEGDSTKVRPSVLAAYTHRFSVLAVILRYEQGFRNRFGVEIDDSGVTFTRSAGIFLVSSYFRDLTVTLGFNYQENTWENASVGGAPVGTTDRTWGFNADLRYQIARPLFLTLGYAGLIRTSTDPTEEFYENVVRLGMTYRYQLF